METTIEKFARKCSITGKGMNQGWCIGEGQMYVKGESDMLQHIAEKTEYDTLQQAYDDEYCYYTEWNVEHDMETTFYDEDGKEYAIKYKHQRLIGNDWEDTEHDGDGNVIVYDTKAEADTSLQEYIDDVNDAHANGDMDSPYEDDCKVVEFFEAI